MNILNGEYKWMKTIESCYSGLLLTTSAPSPGPAESSSMSRPSIRLAIIIALHSVGNNGMNHCMDGRVDTYPLRSVLIITFRHPFHS